MSKESMSVRIVADSINHSGNRLTTFVLRYPRIIHGEFMTHRVFSRNAASSRAIPLGRMLDKIESDPFIPWHWYVNQSGMQGDMRRPLEGQKLDDAVDIWYESMMFQLQQAMFLGMSREELVEEFGEEGQGYSELNVHKSIPNRLLEPFMWMETIGTVCGAGLLNFFKQRLPTETRYDLMGDKEGTFERMGSYKSYREANDRLHKSEGGLWLHKEVSYGAAEPHFQDLALSMLEEYSLHKPVELNLGEWHVPFGDRMEGLDELVRDEAAAQALRLKVATARCARVSYMTHDGKIDFQADAGLHARLLDSGHWSPFEHCARAIEEPDPWSYTQPWAFAQHYDKYLAESRNFQGFGQYRALVEKS